MKILQLCYKTNEVVSQFDLFEEVARAFNGSGDEFIFGVLTGEADPALPGRIACPVEHFHFAKRQTRAWNLFTLARLIGYIRKHRIDLVITHRFKPCLLMAVASPFLPNCRFIAVFHGLKQFDRRSRQWMAKLLFNGRWRVVAVSRAVHDDLVAHGVAPGLVRTIPNAIDIEGIQRNQLSRSEARRRLGLPDNATVIGTLGGTRAIKGHRYLVEAFARIAPAHPDSMLILLGGGEQEEALRTQAAQLGIGDRMIITGMIADGYRYLQALDLFVQPSLSEGLPIALLEALATRLPVIGTRVGGIPEVITEEALLVPSADSDALAKALTDVLNRSAGQRASSIAALHDHLLEHFAVDVYRRRYRELAREMHGARSQGRP
jgi:glycosyltransferase involved in cell wall biosynthesis